MDFVGACAGRSQPPFFAQQPAHLCLVPDGHSKSPALLCQKTILALVDAVLAATCGRLGMCAPTRKILVSIPLKNSVAMNSVPLSQRAHLSAMWVNLCLAVVGQLRHSCHALISRQDLVQRHLLPFLFHLHPPRLLSPHHLRQRPTPPSQCVVLWLMAMKQRARIIQGLSAVVSVTLIGASNASQLQIASMRASLSDEGSFLRYFSRISFCFIHQWMWNTFLNSGAGHACSRELRRSLSLSCLNYPNL